MSIIHRNIVNLYISQELNSWLRDLIIDFRLLGKCLFGAVKVTKNNDPDK